MIITISPNQKIVTDKLNWIYCSKFKTKFNTTGKWYSTYFYSTLEECYRDMCLFLKKPKELERVSDAMLKSVIDITNIKKKINRY